MKKIMSLVVVSLMLMALFLVGCSPMEVTDEDLEAGVAEMTDEELEAVVESTDDTVALAGQAVRMTDKTKLMASKELISRIKNKAPIINPKISLSTYLDTNIVIKEARADITKVSVHYDMPSKSAEMITPEMTLQMLNSMIDSGAFGNGLVGKICCAEIDDLGEVCTEC